MGNKGVELSFQVDSKIQEIWSKQHEREWQLPSTWVKIVVSDTKNTCGRLSRNIYAMMSLEEIQEEKRILNSLLLEGRIDDSDYYISSQLIIHAEDNLKKTQ